MPEEPKTARTLLRVGRIGADTTVIPANVAYLTDSWLLAEAVGKTACTTRRVRPAAAEPEPDPGSAVGRPAGTPRSPSSSARAAKFGREESTAVIGGATGELGEKAATETRCRARTGVRCAGSATRVEVFAGSGRYLEAAGDIGLRRVVVSSGANTAEVLHVAGVAALVEGWIDGRTIGAHGLKGKPAPDAFIVGARCVGVEPAQAAFEDSLAGVAAGRGGGFGFVLGVVDPTGHASALRAHGADGVVSDLAELLDGASRVAVR